MHSDPCMQRGVERCSSTMLEELTGYMARCISRGWQVATMLRGAT